MTDDTESLRLRLQEELVKVAQFPNFNPGPVLRLDADGCVLLANRAASVVFDGDSLVGRSWLDICPGMDDETWSRASMAIAEPFAIDTDLGGRAFTFNHVRSPEDELVFVFGTDVTARREAEQEIREVARFPDMNPGPVLRMDEASIVRLNNAAARTVFGGDLVGRPWLDICPGVDAEFWATVLSASDVMPLEASVDGRSYLFVHRHDPGMQLVFVFGSDITEHKLTERALVQSERMATLGTLAAGVAHELNNPAAATRRAADHLEDGLRKVDEAHAGVNALGEEATEILRGLEIRARTPPALDVAGDAIARADAEAELEDCLDDMAIPEAWELAPALVTMGVTRAELESLARMVNPEALAAIVVLTARIALTHALVREIAESSTRISGIVNALKGYSYLDQAPSQNVDIHRGIDDTLVILSMKLKGGIVVHRLYDPDLPLIPAFGGELNQVWTNLLDNAVDAMGGVGEITISTRTVGDVVEIEISDTGPGIPPKVAARVFDPFFTTKDQGKGTGLGLSTSHSIIVDRHGGSIGVESSKGDTRFTVRLPVSGPVRNDSEDREEPR